MGGPPVVISPSAITYDASGFFNLDEEPLRINDQINGVRLS